MSHWNYRVTKQVFADETVYSIREVYYGKKGQLGWTETDIAASGGTLDEVRGELIRMLEATLKPVLDITDEDNPVEDK